MSEAEAWLLVAERIHAAESNTICNALFHLWGGKVITGRMRLQMKRRLNTHLNGHVFATQAADPETWCLGFTPSGRELRVMASLFFAEESRGA